MGDEETKQANMFYIEWLQRKRRKAEMAYYELLHKGEQ